MTDSEFAKRAADKPDPYTLAWWSKQFQELMTGYRGATHSVNRAVALLDDCHGELIAIRKRVEAMERERESDRAKIGEIAARVERMAEYLNSMKKNGGTNL